MAEDSAHVPLSTSYQLRYWLPPVLWMAAIFGFSTDAFSAGHTGSTLAAILRFLNPAVSPEFISGANFLVRKSAHFTAYATLAALWLRAFRAGSRACWQWRWAFQAFLITAVYALLDEYHQSFTRQRTGSIYDSLLDMAGAATLLLACWGWSLRRRERG